MCRSILIVLLIMSADQGFSRLRPEEADLAAPRVRNYPWMSLEKWRWFHQCDLDRAKEGPVDLLFIGDSITECWDTRGLAVWNEYYEPLRGANFGVEGDTTQNVLWRITEGGALNAISPRVVVVMIGTKILDFLEMHPLMLPGVSPR